MQKDSSQIELYAEEIQHIDPLSPLEKKVDQVKAAPMPAYARD